MRECGRLRRRQDGRGSEAGAQLSEHDPEIVMQIMLGRRQFRVIVLQEGPGAWGAAVSERAGERVDSQPLGYVEGLASPAAALRGVFDHLLRAAGID